MLPPRLTELPRQQVKCIMAIQVKGKWESVSGVTCKSADKLIETQLLKGNGSLWFLASGRGKHVKGDVLIHHTPNRYCKKPEHKPTERIASLSSKRSTTIIIVWEYTLLADRMFSPWIMVRKWYWSRSSSNTFTLSQTTLLPASSLQLDCSHQSLLFEACRSRIIYPVSGVSRLSKDGYWDPSNLRFIRLLLSRW